MYLANPLIWGWANMDGVHYLSIAQNSYFQYEQAFFPLYPLMVRVIGNLIGGKYLYSSLLISHASFLMGLIIFYKLSIKIFSVDIARWAVIGLLLFPTSFFFVSVYTEGLFFFLIMACFYFFYERNWFLTGVFGGFATATRLVGIFILPALFFNWIKEKKRSLSAFLGIVFSSSGLALYMFYLWNNYGDPLLFFHVQPAFGAGRSGGNIILLPQVIYRYLMIFFTARLSLDYLVALFEFFILFFAFYLLIKNFKKIPLSFQIFAWFSLLLPTLTGSLSSLPRYSLTIFPIFLALAFENKIFKFIYLILSSILLFLLTSLFFRGYFVS